LRERKTKAPNFNKFGAFFMLAPEYGNLPISTSFLPKITNISQIFCEYNLLEINIVKMATVGFEIRHSQQTKAVGSDFPPDFAKSMRQLSFQNYVVQI